MSRQNPRNSFSKISGRPSYNKNLYKSGVSFVDIESLPNPKPFTRKPAHQTSQPELITMSMKEINESTDNMETSIIDTQSIVSGKDSSSGAKFVRRSRRSFLSPKNQSRHSTHQQQGNCSEFDKNNESMLLNIESRILESEVNNSVNLESRKKVESDLSSDEEQGSALQKSVSTNSLLAHRKPNKTKNMILSKFEKKQSPQFPHSNAREIELSQKSEEECSKRNVRRLQEKITDLERKNTQQQKETNAFKKSNHELKEEILRLKKRVQTLSKQNSSQRTLQKTSSLANIEAKQSLQQIQRQCKKCAGIQKSKQQQTAHFENQLKKKEQELTPLRYSLTSERTKNAELEKLYRQTQKRLKSLELQNAQKVDRQDQLNQEIEKLKEQIGHLQQSLRYMQLQNSVLLKIKNDNLKLKIDITKIEDERDYFKMKIMEIHGKNGSFHKMGAKSGGASNKDSCHDSSKKALLNGAQSKKFYLESTETEESDGAGTSSYKRDKFNRSKVTEREGTRICPNKATSKPIEYLSNSTNPISSYADTLFDLTSEDSQADANSVS